MKKIIITSFLVSMAVFALFQILDGMDRDEQVDCLAWREQSAMPSFYLLPWQKAQCDHFGIGIDAPVRNY